MSTVPAYWNHGDHVALTLHLGMGMAMSVSRPQAGTPTFEKMAGGLGLVPPFWELEDLLVAGMERDAALAVMAARRGRPMLVRDAGPVDHGPRLLWSRFRRRLDRD